MDKTLRNSRELRITAIVIVGLSLTIPCYAADNTNMEKKAHDMALEFSNAQAQGNTGRRDQLYDEIIAEKEVVDYIRKNHRDTYHLLKLQSTQRKLDKMQNRYGTRRPRTRRTSGPGILQSGTPTPSSVGSNQGAPDSNRSYSQNFANQKRTPNRVRSSMSNSRIRGTNSDAARSFSNRSRARSQSNQRRMRRGR